MLIATADIHLGSGKSLGPNRNEDILNSLDQVIDYALRKRPKYFALIGDCYDYPSPSSSLRESIARRIKYLVDVNIHVLLLSGNHDFANGTHALSEMKELEIDKLSIIDKCSNMFDDDMTWIFFPHNGAIDSKSVSWYSEISNFVEKKKKRKRIVLGHFPVVGSKLSSSNYRYKSSESVTKETLKKLKADLILLGDIHKSQELFKNCYYVGSVDRIDFGEKNDQKSFIHVTRELKVKRIKIKNRTMMHFIVGEDKYKSVKDAIVKPIINCDESEVNKFNTSMILEKLSKAHFVLPFEWNITDRKKKEGKMAIKEIDIKKYLKKFIKRNYPKKNSKRLVDLYDTIKTRD